MAPPRASWKGYLKIAEAHVPGRPLRRRVDLRTHRAAYGQSHDGPSGPSAVRRCGDRQAGRAGGSGQGIRGRARTNMWSSSLRRSLRRFRESDKTLTVSAFVDKSEVDDVYFDRPYYLAPSDRSAEEAFALIREGLRRPRRRRWPRRFCSGAFARCWSARSARAWPPRRSISITRSARPSEAFADVPEIRIKGEMLELAEHIINTKRGDFDPAALPRPLRGGARGAGEGEARGQRYRRAEAAEGPGGR